MSIYKIEKGIPMPPAHTYQAPPPTYPFRNMEVGDSFVVPRDKEIAAWSAAARHKARTGQEMRTVLLPDGSRRIWRAS